MIGGFWPLIDNAVRYSDRVIVQLTLRRQVVCEGGSRLCACLPNPTVADV